MGMREHRCGATGSWELMTESMARSRQPADAVAAHAVAPAKRPGQAPMPALARRRPRIARHPH